jgi:hypothetical protein
MPASQKLELVYPMDLLNAPACARAINTDSKKRRSLFAAGYGERFGTICHQI